MVLCLCPSHKTGVFLNGAARQCCVAFIPDMSNFSFSTDPALNLFLMKSAKVLCFGEKLKEGEMQGHSKNGHHFPLSSPHYPSS